MNNNKLDEMIASVNEVIRAKCPMRVNGSAASNRTQEYAGQVMTESCRRLHKLGYYLSDIGGLQEKHIAALVTDWHAQPLATKTMQNQLSRLRIFCRWLGRENLVKKGGVASYFPELDPKAFKVSTVAVKSKSWSGNGLDVVQKIKEAWLHDARHGGMLMLGVAFGLRKKEMLRIKLWKADMGTSLDIDGSVAKNGRFRSIPIESGEFAEFGLAQRRALDEVKKLCGKYETLGWRGLTFKQGENRYYHYMRRLGLTKFDEGVTGHGARAEYAERMLVLRGLVPATLGGGPGQMDRAAHDQIVLEVQRNMGHKDTHTFGAYAGSTRGTVAGALGARIGRVFALNKDKAFFAMAYANPAPVQSKAGSYRILSQEERARTTVSVVVEVPDQPDERLDVSEFVERWPAFGQTVWRQLVAVGLGGHGDAGMSPG